MKTLERKQLTPHKVAHIQKNRYDEFYVAIEQTYYTEFGPDSESTEVLQAKTYKTIGAVEKFIKGWR